MNEQVPQLAALVGTVNTQLRQWRTTQDRNLAPEQSKLASERSRLDQKERKYREAKTARKSFLKGVAYWSVGAIPFLYLLSVVMEMHENGATMGINIAHATGFFWLVVVCSALGAVLLIGLFVVIKRINDALNTIGNFPVSSGERRKLDQQQTEINNKQREIANKEREVKEHIQAAQQVIASWPPKRVVPFF